VIPLHPQRAAVLEQVLEAQRPLLRKLRGEVPIQTIQGSQVGDALTLAVVSPARPQAASFRQPEQGVHPGADIAIAGVGRPIVSQAELDRHGIQELQTVAEVGPDRGAGPFDGFSLRRS